MDGEFPFRAVRADDSVGAGVQRISLEFGNRYETTVVSLFLKKELGPDEVAEALRGLADRVEELKSADDGWHADIWNALSRSGTESPRRGEKKTRGRSVAPAPQPEKSMANKKTAKKRAKKMAKASKKPC